MNRSNFKEGSIQQIIFDYWDGKLATQTDFENALMELDKEDLVNFITTAQCNQRFAEGYIHP